MTALTVPAHAKINLSLKILGRRPDGFHELESVLQTVTLHDSLHFEPRPTGVALRVDPPGIPSDETNLVWKAAAALRQGRGDRLPGVQVRLTKRIPSGAGLGGGSSDAAAALLGLNRLWGLGMGRDELAGPAAGLGSDVPFFLQGGTARVTGRGSEVEPLADLGGYLLLIVDPGQPLPTASVYAQLQDSLTPAPKIGSMTRFGRTPTGDVEAWVRVGNDLEPHARSLCPAIGEIKDRLLHAGATAAAMTGSGSAVFGVFREAAAVERAARQMERQGWTALRAAPVDRRTFLRGLGVP
jgi:4-diphosphocytidyl-2-C-methyl-D-erythritol kinase